MKRTKLMLVITVLLTFGLVSYAAAHMMGGGHGQATEGQSGMNNQSNQSGNMGPGMMNNGYGMMNNGYGMMGMISQMDTTLTDMSQNSTKMSREFDSFEAQYRKMMKMQDINQIKAEMSKLYNQMQAMHDGLMQQQVMSQNALSMMNNRYQNGMTVKTDRGRDGLSGPPLAQDGVGGLILRR